MKSSTNSHPPSQSAGGAIRRSRSLVVLVCLLAAGPHLTACAKAREASQASEPAPAEAEEKARDGEGAAKKEDDALRQKAAPPGAPQPAAPPPAAEHSDALPDRDEARGGNALEERKPMPDDIEDASEALSKTFSNLERALELSVPDCTTAKQLRDRVCELSEHICRLADETDTRASQELCGDGRGRCADARKRYEITCAE